MGYPDEAARLAAQLGDAILAAEVLYGLVDVQADRFRSGLETIVSATEMLEAMSLDMTRFFTPTETWLADALPETAPIDVTGEGDAAAVLHAAGIHFRRCTHSWFLASTGRPGAAITFGEQYVAALAEAPGARGGIRSTAAFSFHGLGIAQAALAGHTSHVRRGRARLLFAEYDHHSLVAFTLLNELRDVALTYGAADPSSRRQVATEAEAALSRAGGALRPGVSPKLALLTSLVLDGQWNEALTIAHDLPEPGNAYLRREVRGALGAYSADIAASLRSPGSKSMSSFLVDRRPSPATSSIKKDYSSSASQSISAWTRAIFRALMLG